MKEKVMNFKNKVIDFFKNTKNKVPVLIKENKKTTIILMLVLVVVILGIILLCNKTKLGNTSGNLNNSGFSVKNKNWVYYLGLKNSNTDGIYKIKENGKKEEKISDDYGIYLNKSGNYLYYLDRTTGNYDIVKMKQNGKDKEVIISDVDVAKITVVDNWIYYFKDAKFYKAKTNGESKQILSKRTIDNYEVVEKWIYYSYINNGKYVIAKMNTNGEKDTKIDDDTGRRFYVSDNDIYYISEKYNTDNFEYTYELYKIKTNGKNKEKITDINGNIDINSVNFSDNKMYYTKVNEDNKTAIYSMKLNGKDEKIITELKGYTTFINVHESWIYYTDKNDNEDSQMFRIKENGKGRQAL